MGGNIEGARKAVQTNLERHGEDFYSRIGRMGGRNGHTGGFAGRPDLARAAGKKGGAVSARGGVKMPELMEHKEEILKMIENGDTYRAIASKFGVCYSTLKNFLNKIDAPIPVPSMRISTIEREMEKIVEENRRSK